MTSTALADQGLQHSQAHLQGLLGRPRQHDLLCMGVKIRWRAWGHGPRVLLVHGGHGSWTHWVKNIGELAAHFEVMVPDLPGFGDSDVIPNATNSDDTLARMVDCLVHGLSQLPGNSPLAHVAAFSFGALLAARLACRMPTLQTLTLLGPAGHGSRRRQTTPLIKWQALHESEWRDALRQNLVPFMLHRTENVDALAVECYVDACKAARFRSKGVSAAHDIGAVLQQAPCPVRIVWGEADVTATPYEAAHRLSALHHDCQWTIISNAGHWVQYEQHELINALLLSWWLPAPKESM